MIKLAAVEDHRLLIDGLRAWAETVPDIEIAVVTATVDEFLLDSPETCDVCCSTRGCALIQIRRPTCAG